jgi:hypothetical protein
VGSGAAMLASLAAAGVGMEGDNSRSPAAAAAAAASRAAQRATRSAVRRRLEKLDQQPCGVMAATVAMLRLLDMRGGGGVAATEATELVKEAIVAALGLLGVHGLDAKAEAAGSLAAGAYTRPLVSSTSTALVTNFPLAPSVALNRCLR